MGYTAAPRVAFIVYGIQTFAWFIEKASMYISRESLDWVCLCVASLNCQPARNVNAKEQQASHIILKSNEKWENWKEEKRAVGNKKSYPAWLKIPHDGLTLLSVLRQWLYYARKSVSVGVGGVVSKG